MSKVYVRDTTPLNYTRVWLEGYTNGTDVVILDQNGLTLPDCDDIDENDPAYHNCDAMGCGHEHVLARLSAEGSFAIYEPSDSRRNALTRFIECIETLDELSTRVNRCALDIQRCLGRLEYVLDTLGYRDTVDVDSLPAWVIHESVYSNDRSGDTLNDDYCFNSKIYPSTKASGILEALWREAKRVTA